MSYTNPILPTGGSSAQSVYTAVTTPLHPVGTRAKLSDGREFEYVRSAHGTAIGKGKLVTYDPVAAAVDKLAVGVASAIGSMQQSVTVATASDNLYAGAWLSIDDDAGEAELYRIVSHQAVSAVTTNETVFYLDRPLVVATTTATTAWTPCPTATKHGGSTPASSPTSSSAAPRSPTLSPRSRSVGAARTLSNRWRND